MNGQGMPPCLEWPYIGLLTLLRLRVKSAPSYEIHALLTHCLPSEASETLFDYLFTSTERSRSQWTVPYQLLQGLFLTIAIRS